MNDAQQMTTGKLIKIDIRQLYIRQFVAMLADTSQDRKYPTEKSLVTVESAAECFESVLTAMMSTIERYQQLEIHRAQFTVRTDR